MVIVVVVSVASYIVCSSIGNVVDISVDDNSSSSNYLIFEVILFTQSKWVDILVNIWRIIGCEYTGTNDSIFEWNFRFF